MSSEMLPARMASIDLNQCRDHDLIRQIVNECIAFAINDAARGDPLERYSVTELRARASQYRDMAASARTAQTSKDCSSWQSGLKRWRIKKGGRAHRLAIGIGFPIRLDELPAERPVGTASVRRKACEACSPGCPLCVHSKVQVSAVPTPDNRVTGWPAFRWVRTAETSIVAGIWSGMRHVAWSAPVHS